MISRIAPKPSFAAALLLAAAAVFAPPLQAQPLELSADPLVEARAAVARKDPAEALSRYLRVLAARPRDFDALMGAGKAALDIGDPSAAIGFFARAEEIAPRNGRVKAGLGSAMLQMENSGAALRLFNDAVLLGMSEADVAGDRGLAYDLRGENRRAQQDYALALRSREDGETRRRLALSIAISGDQAGALAMLDPLLRRQDVGAWRVRAFILALTGDVTGAESAAYAVMPRSQAAALAPFLVRLPGLRPAQKAAAVHFGHFPSDGRRYSQTELFADTSRAAAAATSPSRPDVRLIPAGPPLGRGAGTEDPSSTSPRRRPGQADPAIVAAPVKPAPAPVTVKVAPAVPPVARTPFGPPAPPPEDRPKPVTTVKRIELADLVSTLKAAEMKEAKAKEAKAKAAAEDAAITRLAKDSTKSKDSAKAKIVEEDKGKAGKASKESAKAKDEAKTKDGDKTKDGAKAKAASKSAERYWVQIAGGANEAELPRRFAQLKEKWPKLLKGRSAWTTPQRATNRLLIGPFTSAEDAQAFVNSSGREGFSTFAFTSAAGQDVDKLAAK